MELEITFSVVQCACGAERHADHRCADCRREPNEVDPHVCLEIQAAASAMRSCASAA
jgi:hypothetical protein